jgi:hypothetical protein
LDAEIMHIPELEIVPDVEVPDATDPELRVVPDPANPELTTEPEGLPLPLPPVVEPVAPASKP